MKHRIPFRVQPVLATLVPEPFDWPGWAYEEKYDGVRILAYKKEEGRVRLLSRNEKDRTEDFPRIATAIRILQPVTLLLDGEVVVFDKKRVSRFQLLQQDKGEPVYVVFAECYCHLTDLQPMVSRLSALQNVEDTKDWSRKILPLHTWKRAPLNGWK